MNNFNILDLPDEVLFIILKKIKTIEVLSSLVDVNQRYTRDLDMTCMTTINSLYDQTLPTNTQVLSKICKHILPRIHHQLHKLTVEEYSMKEILLAANYPQLYSLSLFNFQEVTLRQYLIGKVFNFRYNEKK
jgi:hypothetical protein